MFYKVGILGATGRMGIEISALLAAGFEVKGDTLECADAVASSHRVTSVDGITVRTLNETIREPVHVWIDFSRPEATRQLLTQIESPLVIGTTGLTPDDRGMIERYSEKHPVLLASNTSPGMAAMTKMLEANPLRSAMGYDIVASEQHHRHKKDAPSGTLKSLLKILEAQGNHGMQVQYARVGDEKGLHTISFISDDEELTITHRVHQRSVFARGALLAAHFIARQKTPGLYSFHDIQSEVES